MVSDQLQVVEELGQANHSSSRQPNNASAAGYVDPKNLQIVDNPQQSANGSSVQPASSDNTAVDNRVYLFSQSQATDQRAKVSIYSTVMRGVGVGMGVRGLTES